MKRVYHRFVGNRFHIYFLDAGLCYYYADHILEFFSRVHQPSNGLQKAVVDGLGNSDILVALRALGLVGKYVTALG